MSQSPQLRQVGWHSLKRLRLRRALSVTRRALLEALREVEDAIRVLEALLHDRTPQAKEKIWSSGARAREYPAPPRRRTESPRQNGNQLDAYRRALSEVGRRMISSQYAASGPPHRDARRAFTVDLVAFNAERGARTVARTINTQPLSHYDTLCAMLRAGGLATAVRRRALNAVCAQLDVPEAGNSGTFRLKVTYIEDLFHYEFALVHGTMPDADDVDYASSGARCSRKYIVD